MVLLLLLLLLLMDQSWGTSTSSRGLEEAVAGFMQLPSGLELAQHSGLGPPNHQDPLG